MKALLLATALCFMTGCATKQNIPDELDASHYANNIVNQCKAKASKATKAGYPYLTAFSVCVDNTLAFIRSYDKEKGGN